MEHIKREGWFGGDNLNGENCGKLIDQNEVMINNIEIHLLK